MKVCVVGAGAIGGLLAVKLIRAGEDVTIVDRGAHLDAIRRQGLKLITPQGDVLEAAPARATHRLEDVEAQDLVILAVKSHVIPDVAPKLGPALGSHAMLMPVQNGLPWWYFQKHGGDHDGRPIEAVDPEGIAAKHIPVEHIIGCVVFPAGELTSPGVIKHVEGNRFPVGELDGSDSERIHRLVGTLTNAGFKSFVLDNIRAEIWLKLWGNLSFNPISALTHATLVDICRFLPTRQLAADMMAESEAVANALGVTLRLPIEKRIEGAEKVGKHKTSMLQDVEAGRSLELDAVVGAVVELARLTGVATPAIDTVYALIRLLDRTMAQDHGAVQLRKIA